MEEKTKMSFNIVAIVCIIILSIVLAPVTLQNDTFYTIKIGETILENGIDMQDPFSFHDISYTYPHWLYDVGIYLIFKMGGMLGIYISTIVLSCILGITMYLVNRKVAKNDLISFLLTLGAMYVLGGYIAARAQLVTFILFTLQIFFIEKFIDTKKKRYVIGLIVIPIIIANVHLAVWPFYFIPFLPYVGEYIIALVLDSHILYKFGVLWRKDRIKSLSKKQGNEEKIKKIEVINKEKEEQFEEFKRKQQERRNNPYKLKIVRNDNVKWLILIMIICIFTGLLTPLGDTPYTYLVKTMQGNTTQSINEHLPLVLIQSEYALAIIGIILAVTIFTDTKIRLKDFFMLGGLIVLTLMSRRQLSMLVILGVYSLNILLNELFGKYDKNGIEKYTKIIATGFGRIITILLVVLVSICIYKQYEGAEFIDKKSYPVEASKYIKENLDLENIRLFNEYNYGSYLIYEGIPVFIDSRADLYTPEFNGDKDKDVFTDFVKASGLSIDYESILEKYEITHVILQNNSKMNIYVSKDENYEQLYKDEYFTIYKRLNI